MSVKTFWMYNQSRYNNPAKFIHNQISVYKTINEITIILYIKVRLHYKSGNHHDNKYIKAVHTVVLYFLSLVL
jgi:hypothetical protein